MSRKVKNWTVKDFQKILKNNFYTINRQNGDHQIWTNGINTISIPICKKELNMMLSRRLIKDFNLHI